jgi:hypothetical protein
LIDELGLTRQDLTAALRALDVEYLIVTWPERITYRGSDPSTLTERITSRAREAVGLPEEEQCQPQMDATGRSRAIFASHRRGPRAEGRGPDSDPGAGITNVGPSLRCPGKGLTPGADASSPLGLNGQPL